MQSSRVQLFKRRRTTLVAAGLACILAVGFAMCGNSSKPNPQEQSKTQNVKTTPHPTPTRVLNPYDAQIPSFPKAPTAIPVTLPDGGDKAPIIRRVPTDQPVAFITIDDGNVRHPEARALLQAANVQASAFLISRIAALDPGFFQNLQTDGMPIQAHSVNHTNLRGQSYDKQRSEICGSADELAAMFGTRPTLFRPPYGEYDDTTLRAAKDCGMKAVLYWSESVTDGNVYYQTPEKKIQPGDIILLHFRDALVVDILATLRAIYDSGLTPALLEDYIQ